MAEYIEREKARELIKNFGKGAIEDGKTELDPVDDIILLAKGVDLIPTADVVEVRHGKWKLYWDDNYLSWSHKCSECGKFPLCKEETMHDEVLSNYCPNCGAKMNGKDDNDG